jgi:hypothetical protein
MTKYKQCEAWTDNLQRYKGGIEEEQNSIICWNIIAVDANTSSILSVTHKRSSPGHEHFVCFASTNEINAARTIIKGNVNLKKRADSTRFSVLKLD